MLRQIVEDEHAHFRFLAGMMLCQTIALAVSLGQWILLQRSSNSSGGMGSDFGLQIIFTFSFVPPFLTYMLWNIHEDSLAITRLWLAFCIYLLVGALVANNPDLLGLQLALGVPPIVGLPVSLRKHESDYVPGSDDWW